MLILEVSTVENFLLKLLPGKKMKLSFHTHTHTSLCVCNLHTISDFQKSFNLNINLQYLLLIILYVCWLFPTVETSQAGPGNLEVTVNGGRVPTSAQAQGPHTYAISFTPREAIAHTVDLRFNGEDVPGTVQIAIFWNICHVV
jgi:hypothetical protein